MRKLILRMLTSIDGFIADTGGDLRFGAHWSEELQWQYVESFERAGGLIYGRSVYEKYVTYWVSVAETGKHAGGGAATEAEVRYATRVRDLPKYVASNSLTSVTGNTVILGGDGLVERVADLKDQPGGDLLLMCGPALLSTLSAHRLVDEYMLDVYPIALGVGVHLFRDLPNGIPVSLTRSRQFPQGVNLHIYKPQYDTAAA